MHDCVSARFVAGLLVALSVGCTEQATPDGAGTSSTAALSLLGRTVLHEVDTAVIGRPNRLAITSTGTVLVSDFPSASVLQFGTDGHFLGRIGQKGDGPGEFAIPSLMAQAGSTIVVLDARRRIAQYFSPTGENLRRATELGLVPSGLAADDRELWVGGFAYDSAAATGVVRFDMADLVADPVMRMPRVLVEHPVLSGLGGAQVAVGDDDVLVGFGALDWLYLLDRRTGALRDSIEIPRRVRRGVPLDDARANKFRSAGELIAVSSALVDVSYGPSGVPIVMHWDITPQEGSRTAKYYLSVLSRQGASKCIDIQVPLEPESAPKTRLVADTLMILNQIVDSLGRVTSAVERHWIDTARCVGAPDRG